MLNRQRFCCKACKNQSLTTKVSTLIAIVSCKGQNSSKEYSIKCYWISLALKAYLQRLGIPHGWTSIHIVLTIRYASLFNATLTCTMCDSSTPCGPGLYKYTDNIRTKEDKRSASPFRIDIFQSESEMKRVVILKKKKKKKIYIYIYISYSTYFRKEKKQDLGLWLHQLFFLFYYWLLICRS